MSVSEAARRRMVRAVRDAIARHLWGGALWFRPDGSGGAWYSDNSIPPKGTIVVRLRPDVPAEELVDESIEAWEESHA